MRWFAFNVKRNASGVASRHVVSVFSEAWRPEGVVISTERSRLAYAESISRSFVPSG